MSTRQMCPNPCPNLEKLMMFFSPMRPPYAAQSKVKILINLLLCSWLMLSCVGRFTHCSSSRRLDCRAMSTSLKHKYNAPIVVPPKKEHQSTLIMLHGLGDSGDGWADIAPQLAEKLPSCKFVFPHAPSRPITLNRGMRMPGWYDIASLEDINQVSHVP